MRLLKTTIALLLPLSLALAACERTPQSTAAQSTNSGDYAVHSWPLPASVGAAEPDLIATADGRVLLSWISSVHGRRNALQFVALGDNGHWQSPPRTIVVGNSLLTDWADTPHIAATADGALWVQWLQKTGDGGYSGDVVLSRSHDGGFNWSPPVRVSSDDGGGAEHGFVALWPQSRDHLGIAWLDGRAAAGHDQAASEPSHATAPESHDAPAKAETGTALRTAVFDSNLARSSEVELDAMTCDCCGTAVAVTANGPVLVYRDRSAEDIRDISAVRFGNGVWTVPEPMSADHWKMPACPVNGPAVAAQGNEVLVGWYTAGDDKPRVQLARSNDAGKSFIAPVAVDQGEAVQGRVAVALDTQQAWVLWVREDANGQSLWLARYAPDLMHTLQRIEVAKLQGRGRGTGFPQLAVHAGAAYLVWTDIIDGVAQLHGAIVAAP